MEAKSSRAAVSMVEASEDINVEPVVVAIDVDDEE